VKAARVAGLGGAIVLTVASLVIMFVSIGAKNNAHSTLEQAQHLYQARVDVGEAQEALGDSDLGSAIESARKTNETADRVHAITTQIASLLESAEVSATATSRLSGQSVRNVSLSRKQTKATTDLLGLISGYQRAAGGFAVDTNSALERILRALKRTNRSFPGRP